MYLISVFSRVFMGIARLVLESTGVLNRELSGDGAEIQNHHLITGVVKNRAHFNVNDLYHKKWNTVV